MRPRCWPGRSPRPESRLHTPVAKAARRADPALPGNLDGHAEDPGGTRCSELERLRLPPTKIHPRRARRRGRHGRRFARARGVLRQAAPDHRACGRHPRGADQLGQPGGAAVRPRRVRPEPGHSHGRLPNARRLPSNRVAGEHVAAGTVPSAGDPDEAPVCLRRGTHADRGRGTRRRPIGDGYRRGDLLAPSAGTGVERGQGTSGAVCRPGLPEDAGTCPAWHRSQRTARPSAPCPSRFGCHSASSWLDARGGGGAGALRRDARGPRQPLTAGAVVAGTIRPGASAHPGAAAAAGLVLPAVGVQRGIEIALFAVHVHMQAVEAGAADSQAAFITCRT
jgi:hypothetical protein